MFLEFDMSSWAMVKASRPLYNKFHPDKNMRAEVIDYLADDGNTHLNFKHELATSCRELLCSSNKMATLKELNLPFKIHPGNIQKFKTNVAIYKTKSKAGFADVRGQIVLLDKKAKRKAAEAMESGASARPATWPPGAGESGSILDIRGGRGRSPRTRSLCP